MNSAKIRMAQYLKEDGTASICLQVIINRKVKRIDLKIAWPEKNFDKDKGICKPSRKGKDPLCEDYNLIIGQALAKANEIFTTYRLSRRPLTLELFLKDYHSDFSKQDFISFYEGRMKERFKHKEIALESYKNHNNTLNKLKKWKGTILFHELDHRFAQEFDNALKKLGVGHNTRWNHHKDVKTYLNQARRSHFKFDNPYEYFSISMVKGGCVSLTFAERETLFAFYQKSKIGTAERKILQKFLFGCYSGLRISDQSRLKDEFLQGAELKYKPYKNRRFGQEVEIPLLNRAIELMRDSLRENKCESVFEYYSDQYANRKLKDIAEACGINKNIHHHVGRETFATLFTEAGGSVEELMWYLGHAKIATTMKYVHVKKERLQKRIIQMNELDNNE